ncbi:hypothetical protein K458DRAFT_266880, partial [Lentithecium fluviatile CBS 122367]
RSTLEGHFRGIGAVAFSPDGQLVASASSTLNTSDDNTVRLWEAATGTARSTLEGHSSWVRAVAFSPDGQYIQTDRGDIALSFPTTLLPSPSSHILVQGQWISLNQQRLLWLPLEYRRSFSAVNKNVVCLGHPSGR